MEDLKRCGRGRAVRVFAYRTRNVSPERPHTKLHGEPTRRPELGRFAGNRYGDDLPPNMLDPRNQSHVIRTQRAATTSLGRRRWISRSRFSEMASKTGEVQPSLTAHRLPFPSLMSWIGMLTELLGGVALLVGIAVPLVCVPLIIRDAGSDVHGEHPLRFQFREHGGTDGERAAVRTAGLRDQSALHRGANRTRGERADRILC